MPLTKFAGFDWRELRRLSKGLRFFPTRSTRHERDRFRVARCLVMTGMLVSCPFRLPASDKSPFTNQEQLEYVVKWDPPGWMFFIPEVTAGKLAFTVKEGAADEGSLVHRFQGSAISTSSLLKVNDIFDSASQGTDLCSLRMLKRTHEGKRHREVEVQIDREKKTARVVEKDLGVDPPKTLRDDTIKDFPVCATDLLGALYRARLFPFQPGGVYQILLTDNGRTQEVTLKPIQKEYIKNEAGSFSTQKVEVQSFFGGLFKQRGAFYIWFTEDARHLPVKFEMKVKLGKVYGNLVKVQE
ncbi:MAG: DUF3108 domain-containing protein [Acidobacteriia bacterium]|nr:DUF3108 domain-containing protein [Terriglobia bacterium]